MAWTTPRTWVTGEIVTAALMNLHVRDNLNWIYDRRQEFAIYRYQVASGTGAVNITNLSWQTVPLNTEVTDTASLGTLASNQVSLTAGTYHFSAFCYAGAAGQGKLRLRNITGGATLWVGQSEVCGTKPVYMEGYFTIGSTTTIELQSWLTVASGTAGALTTGEVEVYHGLLLNRVIV